MGTIAIGDIHGNLAALDDLLNRITVEISAEDTTVFLGDWPSPDFVDGLTTLLEPAVHTLPG